MNPALQWTIAIVASYLVGAIPFGVLISRARGVDIRTVGSGNIGATNVLRALGHPWGDLCFALDVLKGLLPTLAFGWWLGVLGDAAPGPARAWLWLAIATASILGHIFPIYLKLRGGKGVATGFGALLGLWPHTTIAALAALAVWYATLRITRYVSVASCVAGVSLPVVVALGRLLGWPARPGGVSPAEHLIAAWPFLTLTILLALLVLWRHRGNLARIRAGTEHKIGADRAEPSPPPAPPPSAESPTERGGASENR